jgi:hypothetical protein
MIRFAECRLAVSKITWGKLLAVETRRAVYKEGEYNSKMPGRISFDPAVGWTFIFVGRF